MTGPMLRWVTPPPKYASSKLPRTSKHAHKYVAMRRRPGDWLLFAQRDSGSCRQLLVKRGFEVTMRSAGKVKGKDVFDVYARWPMPIETTWVKS